MLHNEPELFEQVILRTSEFLSIKAEIIEKDYYVTIFLKELVHVAPYIIFKGGTSLSKCYHLIERFSEDIDLNIDTAQRPSEGQRRQLKKDIIHVVNHFGFSVLNGEDIKSRRDYNRYIIDFPSVLSASYLKERLIVETVVYQRAYPTVKMKADSLIYDYLSANGFSDFAEKYDLMPFELRVQTAERTLIDKLYALADYYLAGTTSEHSRHIYDIYKLLSVVEINPALKALAINVANERRPHIRCLSVQEGVNIKQVLMKIINQQTYREDYENITQSLLFENIPYDIAIQAIQTIIDSELFE